MQLRNPRSIKIALVFLIPVVIIIYASYRHSQFLRQFPYSYSPQFHAYEAAHNANNMVAVVLCVLAGAYFLSHSFMGQPARNGDQCDSLAAGMGTLILAVSLTLAGLGFEHHALKIVIVLFLYFAAAISFWWSYKGYPLSLTSDRS